MSNMAQGRDLADPRTAEALAANVQTLERLEMLLALTVCDIRAVGPGVWNGWKGQLLRTLFWETEVVLGGGHSAIDRKSRVAAAQEALRKRAARLVGPRLRRLCAAPLPRLLAQGRSAAPGRPRQAALRDGGGRPLAGDGSGDRRLPRRHRNDRSSRPTTRACCRSSPAPARRRAATSSTRRSSPPPTASRSTRSRSRAPSSATRTNCGAPAASPARSSRRCAAKSGSARSSSRPSSGRDARVGAFAHPAGGDDRQRAVAAATRCSRSRASTGPACSTI